MGRLLIRGAGSQREYLEYGRELRSGVELKSCELANQQYYSYRRVRFCITECC